MKIAGNPLLKVISARGRSHPLWLNPSKKELWECVFHPMSALEADIQVIRGLCSGNDLFLWPGMGCLHGEVSRELEKEGEMLLMTYLVPLNRFNSFYSIPYSRFPCFSGERVADRRIK